MDRIASTFKLLSLGMTEPGPLQPSSDGDVPDEAKTDFVNAIYIAVEKIRAFGLADADYAGPIKLVKRKEGEKANGRYFPKSDRSVIFYPPARGAPDYVWTIVHEVLHRVWVKLLGDDAKQVWGLLCHATGKQFDASAAKALALVVKKKPDKSSLWFYFKKHFGDDLGEFEEWLKTRRVSDSFPSQYASAEPAEAFSEVAANMILGRGHAGKELKGSGSMIRKVFLSLIGPLRNKDEVGKVFEDLMLESAMPDKDDFFLQTQVDFGYLRVTIPRWVAKHIPDAAILKLEHRPHVTVYYGADKRDLPQIQQIIEDYGRPIRAMLGEFDVFEHEDKDVLYIKVIGDSLRELHDKIAKLSHSRPPTFPNYTPHLTVAYLKKGAARKYVGTTPFRMVISARGLTLIDARGVEQTMRAIPLIVREPLLLAGS